MNETDKDPSFLIGRAEVLAVTNQRNRRAFYALKAFCALICPTFLIPLLAQHYFGKLGFIVAGTTTATFYFVSLVWLLRRFSRPEPSVTCPRCGARLAHVARRVLAVGNCTACREPIIAEGGTMSADEYTN